MLETLGLGIQGGLVTFVKIRDSKLLCRAHSTRSSTLVIKCPRETVTIEKVLGSYGGNSLNEIATLERQKTLRLGSMSRLRFVMQACQLFCRSQLVGTSRNLRRKIKPHG